ncbi:hypothetical protein IAD21_04682 [Abditibacteriota bacterium]|nr:hypothetical protein IAD21_04682 [Abditibacteriota bacterium]
MNIDKISDSGEEASPEPEQSTTPEQPEAEITAESLPQPQLSDEEITRMVDRELGTPNTANDTESNSTLIAFGVTLVAFIYVAILVLARLQHP